VINLVVIKAIRACNLRCSYCYYINEDTPNYGAIMTDATVEALYKHVAAYLPPHETFGFIWHGGEPLMLGRKRLQRFLDLQQTYFAKGQALNLLQTNGVLVNQTWIDFFKRNNIGVGLSLDGSKEAHDRTRVTPSGKGSYDAVVRAVKLFQENGVGIGVLGVPDGEADGYETVKHFQELGIGGCDFLLPMTNNALVAHASEREASGDARQPSGSAAPDFEKIAAFMRGAFRRWIEPGNPEISVRLFESLLQNAFGLPHDYLDAGPTSLATNLVLETDGDVCLDTDFWHIDRFDLGQHYRLAMNVHQEDFTLTRVESALAAFVAAHGLDRLPDACQSCRVRSICHASHPASRYGADGSYGHRSAYCEAMHGLSEDIVDYLNQRGLAHALYDPDLKASLSQGLVP
jgi:uncharacterized protein